MSEKKTEEFVLNGEEVLAKIKELINEGNIRRIIIKNMDDKTLIEIPLTVGVVVALLAPVLAAVGALAAIVTKCKIIVEKKD
ncbi:MAG: DUF4342 domain-containing protein [Candidatus Saccharibacteria bacterium]|nr:DUF4342 domain-containing protein [Candidatus Saccharibacteria bacterium]